MSDFLKKYVNTYRVKAHYDKGTNDFPRSYDGNIDDTFDDYYIPCQKGGEIKHISYTSNLAYYNEKVSAVYKILKDLIKHELGIEAVTRADVDKNINKVFIPGKVFNKGKWHIYTEISSTPSNKYADSKIVAEGYIEDMKYQNHTSVWGAL